MGMRSSPCLGNGLGERGLLRQRLQVDVFAAKLQRPIPHQRARQQSGLTEDLKPVADAQHRPALSRKGLDRLHDRAKPGNRSSAQIVAIAETAGHNDSVSPTQRLLFCHRSRAD